MATMALSYGGAALGNFLGGPMGGMIGQALGGVAGAMIDSKLMGSGGGAKKYTQGPRLKDLDGITAQEGTPIPRVYGRVRIGGQIIWATKFEETSEIERAGRRGGKASGAMGGGGGGAGSSANQSSGQITYKYFANVAIALCEGPVAFVRRIWADGKPFDATKVTMRIYKGSEAQLADPLIAAKQGAEFTPAYRGLCYIVFEHLPLEAFGNRLPQFMFEVVRPVSALAERIQSVTLIPGASEFGLSPSPVSAMMGRGKTRSENQHQLSHISDFEASIDALQALCPKVENVSLVVSWFGDDLRADQCKIAPRIDNMEKATSGGIWSVSNLSRSNAQMVSLHNGTPAYGGTPTDASVIAAIKNLKTRGLGVTLYPFIMMDIPLGNGLPDPHGSVAQPVYPWRGRITCHPAAGEVGSPDNSAAITNIVANFFGTANASHFVLNGESVSYAGPDEWSYRRYILHQAMLAKAAGGVEAFIIGSEMIGLTRLRSASGVYPAVAAFIALLADLRSILGSTTKLVYAADWSEYGAHVLNAGQELRFPLDPLYAHADIAAIGIDYYAPATDWRAGRAHADAAAGFYAASDAAYLRQGFFAGEAYDYYYASEADRAAQIRTPITDGAYHKPWVYRAKDVKGFWENQHFERVNGVELTAPTSFVPKSKPIWLTEYGCPSVDMGSNAPNAFPDAKSSENTLPAFSRGFRDDLVQNRFLNAVQDWLNPLAAQHPVGQNPISLLYNGRMLEARHASLWAYDLRPYPAFPHQASVWADGENWARGHWINGKIEAMPLEDLIRAMFKDYGLALPECARVEGFVDGYIIDRPMSLRAALEPLADLFGFDAHTRDGDIRFFGRSWDAVINITRDDLIPDKIGREIHLKRAQESELPREIAFAFSESEEDFRRASVSSEKITTRSKRVSHHETSAVLRRAEVARLCNIALQEIWCGREEAEFTLRASLIALETGDAVMLNIDGASQLYRITAISDGRERRLKARAFEPSLQDLAPGVSPLYQPPEVQVAGQPLVVILDLPVDRETPLTLQHIGVYASPWSAPYTLWRSADNQSFEAISTIHRKAMIGETMSLLPQGPLWRWDWHNTLDVKFEEGALSSTSELLTLAGKNTLCIKGANNAWEIIMFQEAELIGGNRYRLSKLLRGLSGSEAQSQMITPICSDIVLLDTAIMPLAQGIETYGQRFYYRLSPYGHDYADAAALAFTAEAGKLALQPFSPVQIHAKRNADGVRFSFIRRARRDGDAWEPVEIPLAEENERYICEIYDGAVLKRSIALTTPEYLYENAQELADFGAPQRAFNLRLAQISQSVGQGFLAEQSVPVQ